MQSFHRHKIFLGIIVVLGVVLIGMLVATRVASKEAAPAPETQPVVEEKIVVEEKSTTLVFLGDMIFDRGVETAVKNHFNGDWNQLFTHLDFSWADLVFANLEGPVSDVGRNVGSKWSFRMNPDVLSALQNGGIDIVSFANNHVGDWTHAAFEDTLTRLESQGILYTGAGWNKDDASQPEVIELDGVTFGFLGFTDVGPNWMEAQEEKAGILIAEDDNFETIISNADQQVDVLITSFHWGNEYVPHNERQTLLAHKAIDAGADLVIGHHPHVIQDIEWYEDKLIVYSLGNFIFDQYFSNETMQGMMMIVEFDEEKISNTTRLITELSREYQPQIPRAFETTDVVRSRVSTKSLCPNTVDHHPDKTLFNVTMENSLLNYEPKNITHMNNRIDARGTATCLTPATADALEQMINDAGADGYKIVMTSGYRSHDVQEILYEKYLAKNLDVPYPAVAKPGHSEHQLGTTVDFKSLNTDDFSYLAFGDSAEYDWLVANAHDYGFVQSYPENKEGVTGYRAEPWHWRYVGVEVAKAVQESGLTLTEYLSQNEL